MSLDRSFELRLQNIPRVPLAFLPTPLKEASRLSAVIEGPKLWIKRDDLTGFGFGGNKVRGLEFLLADAQAQKADTLVTGAGRLTRLLGAEVRFTGDPDRASVDGLIESVAAELRRNGRHPYAIPRGGACVLGTLGYVLAAYELAEQCAAYSIVPDTVVLATGSCGTHAGLLAGVQALHLPWRVEGFTVSRPVEEVQVRVYNLAQAALERLGLDQAISTHDVIVHDGFIGPGYGIPTVEGAAAIRLAARSEGIFLDPTYTGKALAGLIAHTRARRYQRDETIIFLHTGGEPALFVGEGEWLNE